MLDENIHSRNTVEGDTERLEVVNSPGAVDRGVQRKCLEEPAIVGRHTGIDMAGDCKSSPAV